MFGAFLPKGAPFFELLLEQNAIICEGAFTLCTFFDDHQNAEKHSLEMVKLEARADKLHLAITRHLSQTFITPIDREDILRINKAQEECVDLMRNAANRLSILNLRQISPLMLRLSVVIREMAQLTNSMLAGLSQKRDSHNTRKFLSLRDECETLISSGHGELYNVEEYTPEAIVAIVKWIRAYDRMELVVNQIVSLAECIEEAVIKNA